MPQTKKPMQCIGFFVGEQFCIEQPGSKTHSLTLYIKKQKHSQNQYPIT